MFHIHFRQSITTFIQNGRKLIFKQALLLSGILLITFQDSLSSGEDFIAAIHRMSFENWILLVLFYLIFFRLRVQKILFKSKNTSKS